MTIPSRPRQGIYNPSPHTSCVVLCLSTVQVLNLRMTMTTTTTNPNLHPNLHLPSHHPPPRSFLRIIIRLQKQSQLPRRLNRQLRSDLPLLSISSITISPSLTMVPHKIPPQISNYLSLIPKPARLLPPHQHAPTPSGPKQNLTSVLAYREKDHYCTLVVLEGLSFPICWGRCR